MATRFPVKSGENYEYGWKMNLMYIIIGALISSAIWLVFYGISVQSSPSVPVPNESNDNYQNKNLLVRLL